MCGATPSRIGAGETFTLRLGTSANFSTQFGSVNMAWERSLPILALFTSNAATKCMSRIWYPPKVTCINPGTVVSGLAFL